jgi:hypothetical protein
MKPGLFVIALLVTAAQSAQPISESLYSDLTWRCIGPFDGGPVASVEGIAGEPGVYVMTTPSGGAWKTTDGGDTWTSIERPTAASATTDPHRWIDPANPRRIVRTTAQGIEVSLSGGETWMASHQLPIAEVAHLTPREHQIETRRRTIAGKPVSVSIADPTRPGLVFAAMHDAVYVSFDDGVTWESLRLNMPDVAINDLDIRGHDLVAATQGRSVWALEDISPLRQVTAASTSAAAILFKPADATNIDYYLGASTRGEVRLEIVDVNGRVIHAASSAPVDPTDRWLPVTRPLSAAPGHHRFIWDLRLTPPPSPQHRYAHLARALFEDTPADPDGPRVLAGSYRVRLIAGGQTYSQPLVVRSQPGASPASIAEARRQFDFAIKMYDAMHIAHRGFLQLRRVREGLRPLLASADAHVAAAAADLDARLNDLDGSDWTGLIVPDADDEAGEVDEKEGIKHPDFVPAKPVSISKDYDDPTSILGRVFNNVAHAPAFAIVGASLGGMLTKATDASSTPDAVALSHYDDACRTLAEVLDAWRAINAQDVPRLNADLTTRKLPRLPIATSVPSMVCGAKAP